MSKFEINNIQPAIEADLQHGTYIVLLNVRDLPPHLLLMSRGELFSLSIKGPKLHLPLELQLKLIKRAQIPSIFVKLNAEIHVQEGVIYKQAVSSTLAFSKADVGFATCLSPIKAFCDAIFHINTGEANFIYELLPLLDKKGFVEGYHGINMQPYMIVNTFFMEKYSMQTIYDSITSAVAV